MYSSRFSFISITALTIALMPFSLAKSETYGPIKGGQTLWDIANETRSDKTISVEQLAYSIYQLNPGAFYSSNMNLLHKGVVLNIPDTETVLKTSRPEAQQHLQQHVHALDLIRVDAKQLRKAKITRSKYKKQVKVLQKKLGKYRHRSRAWNRTYTKLVKAKRNYSKSKRKVVKLTGLLLEKATLKSAPPVKEVVSTTGMTEVNQRLVQIQSSLENLNHSNSELVDKVAQLATLGKRVKVLEEELGKNDDLVVQLKNTLELAQQAIKEQQLKSEYLDQRLEKLDSINSSKINSDAIEKTTNVEEKNESVVETPAATESQTVENNDKETSPTITTENEEQESFEVTTEDSSNPEATTQAPVNKPVENNETDPLPVETAENKEQDSADMVSIDASESAVVSETPIETESELANNDAEAEASAIEIDTSIPQIIQSEDTDTNEINSVSEEKLALKEEDNVASNTSNNEEAKSVEPIVVAKVEEDSEVASDKFSAYEFESESLTAIDTPDEPVIEKQTVNSTLSKITQVDLEAIGTNTNDVDSGSLKRTKLTDVNYPIVGNVAREDTNPRSRNGSASYSSPNYWMQLLKDKIIIIGGILNGIILLFVFYKLLSNRQSTLEIEDADTDFETKKSNSYIPWQDRVKPKRPS